MSGQADYEPGTVKAKKPSAHPSSLSNPGHSGPTTFFLRTEKDLEQNVQPVAERIASESLLSRDDNKPLAASMSDSSFGVQSLEDAISSSVDSMSSPVRTTSNEASSSVNILAGRKRKPGNPVHPKIYAAGQRIVSSEHSSPQASSSVSPDPTESPLRPYNRRSSISSSLHSTPLRLSPHPDLGLSATPRTNSIKSFRLSDEEASIASDAGSQAIQSSSSEEESEVQEVHAEEADQETHFVMPSIAMPTRRPFTERGRNMGKLKVLVVGGCGLGKTSLVRSIFRVCEDIVHFDGMAGSTPGQSMTTSKSSGPTATTNVQEYQASTRPYPQWWSDMDNGRSWWRRKSFSDGILERNLCFVDTPGIDSDEMAQQIFKEVDSWYAQVAALDKLSDSQLLSLLSGDGDCYLDAVLYLFDVPSTSLPDYEMRLLHSLSRRTNVIPLIARSEAAEAATLEKRKADILELLNSSSVEWCSLNSIDESQNTRSSVHSKSEPFAISTLVDDEHILDASTLMASDYLPPLASSDLKTFVDALLSPTTTARLRHQATKKFLSWRRDHLPRQAALVASQAKDPAITYTGSILDEPSKVLVPHALSSYYRSASPSGTESSGAILGNSAYALAQRDDEDCSAEPSRNLHVAKWARDLQRSLRKEGGYREGQQPRPQKGRLGGDLAIIDPKDPLGILSMSQAFRRRGWFALEVIGGCGLISAAAWWIARNWVELQAWVWSAQGGYPFAPIALPAPTRSWIDSFRLV